VQESPWRSATLSYVKSLVVASTVLVAGLLAGCTGSAGTPQPSANPVSAPTPAASASADSASPTSTPSPTPAAPGPAKLLVLPDGLAIYTADDTLVSRHGWFDGNDVLVGALTAAFGSEPEVSDHRSTYAEDPNATVYTWGGFELRVKDHEADPPLWPNVFVWANSARVGKVDVLAEHGTQVGDGLGELHPDLASLGPWDREGQPMETFIVGTVILEGDEVFTTPENYTIAHYNHGLGRVETIGAPSPSYGI
jgi:hypothetical protein